MSAVKLVSDAVRMRDRMHGGGAGVRLLWAAMNQVAAALLLLLLSPVLVVIAIAIWRVDGAPIVFGHYRVGQDGRLFRCLKFRSMVRDSEAVLARLLRDDAQACAEWARDQKLGNDPRITPIGRFLRKTSLDELPQLFNVLRGEMSLVGPRPLPVDEVARFDDPAHRRRLSVKPGLTCLWQISGRNDVRDFKDWVRLDLEYIDNWSFWLDLKILWRTIPVVLTGAGAK